MRILIIGGAGFVGSHLTNACLNAGETVAVYDNFSGGKRQYLPSHHALEIFQGDILDAEMLRRAFTGAQPEVVYHLAAIHHIPTCEQQPEVTVRVNIEGTQTVLSACADFRVPRVIFASTGAVYKASPYALNESTPLETKNIYSISKFAGEQLVRHYVDKCGGEAVIVRLFNVVGAHETNPHLIPEIMSQLASGTRILTLGNLAPRRDYIHVRDVAEALYILGSLAQPSQVQVYNLGSGREYSVAQVVDLMSQVLGEPIMITSSAERQRTTDRLSQLADISKLKNAANWTPRHTLKEALFDAWHERNAGNGMVTAR